MIADYLLSRVALVVSLLPDQNLSPGSNQQPNDNSGKPSTSFVSSRTSWYAPVIVLIVFIMMCFAVAAILLGEK